MKFFTMCPACRGLGEVEHCRPFMDPAPCAVCRGSGTIEAIKPYAGIVYPIVSPAIKETLDYAGL